MCNLYSITPNQAAIAALFGGINQYVGDPQYARRARSVNDLGPKCQSRRTIEPVPCVSVNPNLPSVGF